VTIEVYASAIVALTHCTQLMTPSWTLCHQPCMYRPLRSDSFRVN